LLLAATFTVLLATANPIKRAAVADNVAADPNPLLAPWAGPYGGVPPFDKIRVEHFAPALQAGMAAQRRELSAITANRAAPNFANTVLAFERSGQLLRRVEVSYELWTESLSTPAFQ